MPWPSEIMTAWNLSGPRHAFHRPMPYRVAAMACPGTCQVPGMHPPKPLQDPSLRPLLKLTGTLQLRLAWGSSVRPQSAVPEPLFLLCRGAACLGPAKPLACRLLVPVLCCILGVVCPGPPGLPACPLPNQRYGVLLCSLPRAPVSGPAFLLPHWCFGVSHISPPCYEASGLPTPQCLCGLTSASGPSLPLPDWWMLMPRTIACPYCFRRGVGTVFINAKFWMLCK